MLSRLSDRSRRRLRTTITILVTALLVAPAAALATHGFNDVDDGDFYHAAVDWMKANGVTAGCNPPNNTEYCPDDPVTRGEMAVFLERLDTKNVFVRPGDDAVDGGNADMVDGKDSTAFLGASDTAADSNKLGGKDATAFEQFGGTIPSGATLTGNWYAAPSNDGSGGSNGFFEMTFPTTASAPAEITGSDSRMGEGTANGVGNYSQCTGSAQNPTAPAGTICWYVGAQTGLVGIRGMSTTGDTTRGASVLVIGDGSSDNQYARGSWAYTAP